MASTVTALTMLTVLAVGAVVDSIVAVRYGPEATVSRVIMDLSMKYPIIPLSCGVILGHFFWPQHPGGK